MNDDMMEEVRDRLAGDTNQDLLVKRLRRILDRDNLDAWMVDFLNILTGPDCADLTYKVLRDKNPELNLPRFI